MAPLPVGLGLDQGRSFAFPGSLDRFFDRFINSKHVVAVDEVPRNVVSGAACRDVLDVADSIDAYRHAVLVVLAQEDAGSFQADAILMASWKVP